MNADSLTAEAQAGPLAGLRVLDFSTTAAGAQASQPLADFGAEVVHVEPPGGSQLRAQPGYPFLARGKKSIVLDLHAEGDRAVAAAMASGADVVIETFRPGVMERLGLGYEDLRAANPGLVFGSVTGFGRTGPYAAAKGYEALVMARIGALSASGGMVTRPGPAHVSVPYGSYGASQLLLTGILAALHERRSSGLGQRVDTSLVKGVAALGTWNWYHQVLVTKFPEAFSHTAAVDDSGVPMSPIFFMLLIGLTKDGRWLQFSQVQMHLYMAMLKVMGLDWVLADEDWKGAAFAMGHPRTAEFWERLLGAVRERTMAQWQQVFEDHHDVWAETMRHGSELLGHPQMRHLGEPVELPDAERGPVRQPGPIARLEKTPAVLRGGAPLLDADGPALRASAWPAVAAASTAPGPGTPSSPALGDMVVLELGTFFAAPFGATVLRELGARVIKVEPIKGEPMRTLLPFPELGAAKVMQGKESIAIDMSTDEGRAIVHELARRSHLALQSFRGAAAQRQGVDSATLRRVNPDLVYLDAPAYGTDGPRGDRPAYAPTIGAGSGLVMRNIGASVPEHADMTIAEIRENALRLSGAGTTEYAQADGISALTVASALALGPAARDRTGISQAMRTTMLTSTAHALADDMVEHDWPAGDGRARRRPFRLRRTVPALPGRRRVDLPGGPSAGASGRRWPRRWPATPTWPATPGSPMRPAAGRTTATWRTSWPLSSRPGPRSTGRTTCSAGTSAASWRTRSRRRPSCRARSSRARPTCSCRSSTPHSASTCGSSHTSRCPAARPWPSLVSSLGSTPTRSSRSLATMRR